MELLIVFYGLFLIRSDSGAISYSNSEQIRIRFVKTFRFGSFHSSVCSKKLELILKRKIWRIFYAIYSFNPGFKLNFAKRLNNLTVLLSKAGAIYIAPPPAYQLSRTQTESIQEPHQWFPE